MKANQAQYPVRALCRVLGVSPAGYYAWLERAPCARVQTDARLTAAIRQAHECSHGTYGRPRLHVELREAGVRVGHGRLARLMREASIQGVSRRRGCRTTVRDPQRAPAPDLVRRDFSADAPNRLWVADLTYVPTWAGFLYLAVVLDAFSRRIVGWDISDSLEAAGVVRALSMAIEQRRPKGVIHHSDQGSQYTSLGFGLRCKEAGVRPSMGSVGDAYDNALCESFFATLEHELLARRPLKTKAEARMALFCFIEGFYNPHRRHSSIGQKSPMDFEKQYRTRQHGLSTAPLAPGLKGAGGGAVDNPAPELCDT